MSDQYPSYGQTPSRQDPRQGTDGYQSYQQAEQNRPPFSFAQNSYTDPYERQSQQGPPQPRSYGQQPGSGYPPGQYGYAATQQYQPSNYGQAAPPVQRFQPSPYTGRDSPQPYTLSLTPTSRKHVSSLTPLNSTTPAYLIEYNRPIFYTSRPEIVLSTPSGNQIATAAWHTWSSKIKLNFTSSGDEITYKDNFEPTRGSLGRLFWTLTAGDADEADIKCADRAGATIVTIVLHNELKSGKIEVWRPGLEHEVFEQLIVSAVAEIEDWRKQTESRNSGVNPGVLTAQAMQNFNN